MDRAPKMQESIVLSSWDSFLATLPSISSETCAIYSPVIPGADELRDWLLEGYSCVSVDIDANYSLFLNVPVFGNRFNSGED